MAKKRERPASNPLLKDRVSAIVAPASTLFETDTLPLVDDTPKPLPKLTALPRSSDKQRVQIKARFSVEEAMEVDRLTRTLSSYLGTKVNGSEVTRALWTLATRSQDEFASLSDKTPRLERPSYGNPIAMAQYEDAIAEFLLLALKKTRRGS